jgi:uncharacterized membrane protein
MVGPSVEGSPAARLEKIISRILIAGVVMSVFLEIVGMALFYHSYGTVSISYEKGMLIHADNCFIFLVRQFVETSGVSLPLRLMTLGIAILILTPYARAIASVVYFASRKDLKFLAITMFVLAVLTVSFLTH